MTKLHIMIDKNKEWQKISQNQLGFATFDDDLSDFVTV